MMNTTEILVTMNNTMFMQVDGGVDIGQFQISFRNEIGGAAEPSGKETLHSQIVSGTGPERLVDFVGSGSCFRVFFNDVAVGNHAAG